MQNNIMGIKQAGHGVVAIIGGQAGSEGKGKFAGNLALNHEGSPYNFVASIANFMPNAGHTWVDDNGEKVMVQQLPQACVNPELNLYISAGSAVEIDILKSEIKRYEVDLDRLFIHPRAMIIEERHRQAEAEALNRISSTLKGCGYATADKVSRNTQTTLAQDSEELQKLGIVPTQQEFEDAIWHDLMQGDVMLEAPQGYDLDINHGLEYPHCTSRQTSATQAMADAGLPSILFKDVIAVIRPYPIRVGNATDKDGNVIGYSGDYDGAEEISWEEVARRGGTPVEEINEITTVSKKIRRVFEFHPERLARMVRLSGVSTIALNFANYIDYTVKGKSEVQALTEGIIRMCYEIESQTGAQVGLVGTGAKDSEIISLMNISNDDQEWLQGKMAEYYPELFGEEE